MLLYWAIREPTNVSSVGDAVSELLMLALIETHTEDWPNIFYDKWDAIKQGVVGFFFCTFTNTDKFYTSSDPSELLYTSTL